MIFKDLFLFYFLSGGDGKDASTNSGDASAEEGLGKPTAGRAQGAAASQGGGGAPGQGAQA